MAARRRQSMPVAAWASCSIRRYWGSDVFRRSAKMLALITKTYFNDPAISQVDKTLFTFASYNAGQNRIVRLRKETAKHGLDQNKWFGNVELMVAEDIGQETVQYVANIYKYYVAYKMAVDQQRVRDAAKGSLSKNRNNP